MSDKSILNKAPSHIIFFKDGIVFNNFDDKEKIKEFVKTYIRKYFVPQNNFFLFLKQIDGAENKSVKKDFEG